MDILKKLTEEFPSIREDRAQNIINLIDEGNTIPFIARYRKEMTGSCDDQVLREFNDRLTYLRNLEKRKEEVVKSITDQGKMTEEIQKALDAAATLTEVEDIYRPYKQKKKTRASVAIEKGLQPLADFILQDKGADVKAEAEKYIDAEKGVNSAEEAIAGAKDIIAEIVSDDANVRKKLRNLFMKNGEIQTKLVNAEEEGAKTYEMYADYSENAAEMKSHRVLAVNRGEKEGFLKVKLVVNDDIARRIAGAGYIRNGGYSSQLVEEAVADSYDRLIFPSIEREVRAALTDSANEQAIKMFEVNLKPLLMQPPIKDKITLGLDPAYRTGCKIAVVDGTGKVLDKTVVYPTPGPKQNIEAAKAKLRTHRQIQRRHNFHRKRYGLERERNFRRRTHQRDPEGDGQGSFVYGRFRSRSLGVFGKPARRGGISRFRRGGAQRRIHRAPFAGSSFRADQDRPEIHRRRAVPARYG